MAVKIPRARLPRLLTLENNVWREERRLYPTATNLHLKLNGISQSGLTMEPADKELDMHAFVEIYTVKGSAGIYRVTNPSHRAGVSSTYTLQHAIDTLNDCLWKAQTDFKGTARAFLQGVLACQNDVYWQLGTCEDSGQYKKTGINYDKALDLLLEFATSRLDYYLNFDFTTWPWTLHWKALPMDVRAEWRARRNVRSCSITKNDAEQCTRLYYTVSPPEGQEADPTVHVLNNLAAQARPGVGIIEKAITIDADVVADPAAEAQRYLTDHEYPGVQVTVDGYEYYRQTGDSLDCFDLGILTRCLVEGIGPVRERLVGLVYPDLLDDGEHVSAEMATSLPRFSESLLQAAKAAASAGRRASSAASKAKEEADEQYRHWVTENKVYKESVFKIMGVVLDENGNVVYQKDPVTGELILDDAGNPKPVYDPNSGGSLSGVTRETAKNYTRLYELTGVNALGENETILTRVQQDARQYAIDAVENNMSGYLRIDAFSTKLGNELTGSNGETIASTIVTKINNNQGTIYLNSDHVKLKDGSIITASTLDARLADIDALFTTNGYAAQIKAGTINSGGNINADGAVYGTGIYIKSGTGGGTNVQYTDVSNAVKTIRKDTTLADGLIGFEFQTLTGTSWTKVNFNIADTKYFKDRVGIEATGLTVTEIGQTPYNNHSADEITTPEIKAGTSDKYYLISATAKDGTTTVYKKFVLPAAAAPAVTTDPKISKKSWTSGQIQLDASSDPNDPASVTIALTGGTTGSLVYGDSTSPTTPTQIKFDILESVSGSTVDTGADVVASVVRGAATVHLGTNNNAPAIVANTAGYVTVGGQRIQVGVTPLAVTPGTATPGKSWNSRTNQYDLTATGSVSIGSDSLALTQGTDSFTPSDAFTHGFNLCFNSVALSAAKTTLNPGESVDVIPNMKGTWDAAQAQAFSGKKITIQAAQADTVTPKVSKKTWSSSGTLTFEASTASGDPTSAGVALGWITVPNTSSGNAALSVVDKASPYSSAQPHTVLEKNLTLTCENDAAYLKDGGTTLAKVPNNKTSSASIDSIALRTAGGVQYVYDDVERIFTVYLKATGTNVAEKTGEVDIPAASAIDHGKRLVSAVLAETASSAAAPSTLVSGKTYNLYRVVDGTRESNAVSSYTVPAAAAPVSASIDNITGSAIDDTNTRETVPISASGTNVTSRTEYAVLKRDTYGSAGNKCVTLTMDGVVIGRISAQTFYTEGRNSVKITSVERVASCAFDHDAQTAKQDVKVTLDNGQSYTIHEDFSDVYRAGRNGTSADTTIEYAVDLASEGVYFDTVDEGLTIDVSDIYQAGRDYTPPVLNWYIYPTTSSNQVDIYVWATVLSSNTGVMGKSKKVAFYPYTPVELTGDTKSYQGITYTQVSYGGNNYYVLPNNLKQFDYDISEGHRIGIKDIETSVYPVSTTMTGLIHTGGATSGISVYLEPYSGTAKNYSSSYVTSADFSSYRANGSASDYFSEMANKAGYYGRHEQTAYSGDIQHKAIFEILYSDETTETVVVSFNSYAKAADEVVYTYTGYIDASNYVNLRSDATTAGTVLAQVPDRSAVKCQYNPNGYTGTWMPVQYGGKTGYIQSKFIEGTKDWNDLNTKTISTITLVGVAHAMGSSKKDITVTLRPQKNGMKFATSYATESNEYTYDWAVTNTDTDTYLLHPISGCYMYHSKSAYSSTMRMRVKLNVTYTNSSKFPPETVVLQVDSIAK